MNKTPETKLVDRYNRQLNYLRISITDRCNLNCVYCCPEDRIPRLSHSDILTYEEILRIVAIGTRLGISKLRITGGEPLVRKGVYGFLTRLGDFKGVREVTLTTNGVALKDHLDRIWSAGIRRINISLDTMKREKFAEITGRDLFEEVWSGIITATEMGFDPVKLNVVALRGFNEDELVDFGQLSVDHPLHVRFIEYMPIGKSRMKFGPPLLVPEIKEKVQQLGRMQELKRNCDDGPAQRFKIENARGEIGFISALSHHFCGTCNRLRLTASGQLRPCLLSDRQIDLKTALRSNCSDRELTDLFLQAVKHKPSDHRINIDDTSGVSCQMSSIGG